MKHINDRTKDHLASREAKIALSPSFPLLMETNASSIALKHSGESINDELTDLPRTGSFRLSSSVTVVPATAGSPAPEPEGS